MRKKFTQIDFKVVTLYEQNKTPFSDTEIENRKQGKKKKWKITLEIVQFHMAL